MMAISAVDCAMWDLKGRMLGLPVVRLLGGPTRDADPRLRQRAWATPSSPTGPRERGPRVRRQGYTAMKWFYRHGPTDGREGMEENEALVAAVREAVGPDVEIMTDAWMSWDVPYTLEMARRLEPYRPRWIEEPVLPDKIESYAEIRRESPVPIAGGEHEYTRWGTPPAARGRRRRRAAGGHRTGPAASRRCSRSGARVGLRHAGRSRTATPRPRPST